MTVLELINELEKLGYYETLDVVLQTAASADTFELKGIDVETHGYDNQTMRTIVILHDYAE